MGGKLDFQDGEGFIDKSSSSLKKGSNGAASFSLVACEDTQEEADGDDSGYTGKCSGCPEGDSVKSSDDYSSPSPENLSPKSSEEDEDYEIAMQRIFSEPTPVKLISAMKGSREKHGLSPRKLRVSWAPDVYDPPPSIVSHTRGRRQPRSRNSKDRDNHKKNGKKGQKGKSSRGGSSGKDKKQQLRRNAHEGFKDGFEMGGTDSHCGDNFLITSLSKVHYPVAEAL